MNLKSYLLEKLQEKRETTFRPRLQKNNKIKRDSCSAKIHVALTQSEKAGWQGMAGQCNV